MAADQHRARQAAAGHPVRPDWSGGTDHHADQHPAGAVHRDRGRSAAPGYQPAAGLNRSDPGPAGVGTRRTSARPLFSQLSAPNSGDHVLTNCGTRGLPPAETAHGAHHTKAVRVVAARLAERAWTVPARGEAYVLRDLDGSPVTPTRPDGSSPSAMPAATRSAAGDAPASPSG